MRTLQERILPGTVVIQRHTLTRDAMGGFSEAWAAVGTATARLYPEGLRTQSEPVVGVRVTSETRWFATFPAATDVTAQDRLLAGGRTFEVVRVNNGEMWQTAVRCECVAYNEEQRV